MILKIIILLFGFFLIPYSSVAQNEVYFGTSQENIPGSITHYNNKYYILGSTHISEKRALDYYILEVNKDGTLFNSIVFGDEHQDIGSDLIVNQEGIFAFGSTWDKGFPNNDMLLSKISFNNNIEWQKFYGSFHNEQGFGIIKCRDEGFALIGFTKSLDDFGDVYLVKTNSNGEKLWETNFGTQFVDYGFKLVENDLGELIIVGSQGGFFNYTRTDFLNHDSDILVIKTNSEGEKIWYKTYGGNGHDWAKDIIPSPDGGYYVCGSTQSYGEGSFDIFLMKINEDGDSLWSKSFGGKEFDYGESILLNSENNLLISGTTASFSENIKPDMYLIKTDLNGEKIWENSFGGSDSDYGTNLVTTPDSGCLFLGYTKNGPLGKSDIVLLKINSNGSTDIISHFIPNKDSIESLKIFPNPIGKNLFITISNQLNLIYDIEIYNITGKKVYTAELHSNLLNKLRPEIEAGTYFYKILLNGQHISAGKLIFI